jgi:hypothetical protein
MANDIKIFYILYLKGIVSRDFGTLFLFNWIDLKVVIGPNQVNFYSFSCLNFFLNVLRL